MDNTALAFIGGGNMARSLIGGLIAEGFDSRNIWVADPDEQNRNLLRDTFRVNITASNEQAAQQAGVVIFAVKPQTIRTVAEELTTTIQGKDILVVSIAAGIREADLSHWLGGNIPIVRAMPNTPALVRCGATALYANSRTSTAQRNLAESIVRAVGLSVWLDDEPLMDAVTALSGSGPAYFFLVMEALENSGCRLGLARETARLLTLQTAFGAAKMALESTEDSAALRSRVTSPGGTTEQAITVLQAGDLQGLFDEALKAAHGRAIELAEYFAQS